MAHSFQHNMSKDGAAPIQGGNSPFAPRDMGNESPPPSSSFEVPSPNMANQYPLQDSSFDVSAHSSTFHFTFPLQSTPNEFPPQNMYYAGPPQDVASAYQPRPPETPQPKAKRTEDPSPQDTSDSVVIIPGILMVGHAILTPGVLDDTLINPIRYNRVDIMKHALPSLKKRLHTEEFRQTFFNRHVPGSPLYARAANQVGLSKELIAVAEARFEELSKQLDEVRDYKYALESRSVKTDEWRAYVKQCDERFRALHGMYWQSQEKYIAEVAKLTAKSDPEWMSRQFGGST